MPTAKRTKTEHTPGRRTDNAMKLNFEKLCKWLDEQRELFTVSELHAKMCSCGEKDQNAYSLKCMKKQLEQHYQNSFFSQMNQAVRTLSVLRIGQVPFYQNNCTKIGKRILMMKK